MVKITPSFSGAVKINRKAFGKDLLKAPANIAWALPYTAIQVISVLFRKVGLKSIHNLMQKVPAGFKTSVQEEINSLIFAQLLELPHGQDQGKNDNDALLAEFLDQPEVKSLFQEQLALIMSQSRRDGFKAALEKRLREYSLSRNAISELAGNIITLATGAGIMGKMTPGGINFGTGSGCDHCSAECHLQLFYGPNPWRNILWGISGLGLDGISGGINQHGTGDSGYFLCLFRYNHRPYSSSIGNTRETAQPADRQLGRYSYEQR